MTYRILLVDDEPIILSGIKFLIDWEANGCTIAGTARNGQQALEAIEALKPHIVICDISMPVMSGMELLKASSAMPDSPVFIMLTNYGEFNLAIEAMRYRAVDYLLKNQLEAEIMEKSLAAAKQECDRRGGLARVQIADSYIQSNRSQMISGVLKKLLAESPSPKELPDVQRELQGDAERIFDNYCLLHLLMDFSQLPSSDAFTETEKSRLFAWEQEIVEKLAGNTLPDYLLFDLYGHKRSLVLLCQGMPEESERLLLQFYGKLCAASSNVTQVGLSLLSTDIFHGTASLPDAAAQFALLQESYYNTPRDCLFGSSALLPETTPISFGEQINKLVLAIRGRNAEQCVHLLDQVCSITRTRIHRRADAVRECTALYSAVSSILAPMLSEHASGAYFAGGSGSLDRISALTDRESVCTWLEDLKEQLLRQLEQFSASKSDLAEKARTYVIENIDKRIMLQDVADYVGLSPGYLSALFKKEYQQNFVEFINETKMERACVLIREDKYRIYEISYMLGFDNAYYFTKVFKKHTGVTPTEYQRNNK